jgi:MtN3 and saliva related transmembrane protein
MPANKHLHHRLTKKQKQFRSNIDKLCIIAAVFMPLTTLPQIFKLYSTQEAGDLSLAMWVLYCIGVIPFLLYGIIHKEKQLIILNVMWLTVQMVMIYGIIKFN